MESRTSFILCRLRHVAVCFLTSDALAYVTVYMLDPAHFLDNGETLPLDAYGHAWLALNVAVRGSQTLCMLPVIHGIMSIIFVGLGLSEPRLWPDICGSLLDAYTVRRFWGYVLSILSVPYFD